MIPTLEQLKAHFKNASPEVAEIQAQRVLAAIEWLGTRWVGHKESTFVFKRSQGMFGRVEQK